MDTSPLPESGRELKLRAEVEIEIQWRKLSVGGGDLRKCEDNKTITLVKQLRNLAD